MTGSPPTATCLANRDAIRENRKELGEIVAKWATIESLLREILTHQREFLANQKNILAR